jgi:RecB family exonuclease
VITPRTTRLVRTPDLQAFRTAVIDLVRAGDPLDARDRLVIVPTHAAAEHLTRSVEGRLGPGDQAVVLPDMATSADLITCLARRLSPPGPILTDAEREVLCGVSCRAASEAGAPPPFRLRAGLVAEILRFYDALRAHQKDIDTFERLALGLLEPGADVDRGAERLVRQTRFLAAAYRDYERRRAEAGLDRHDLRAALLASPADRPYRHIIVTVGDEAFDPHGLRPADWDVLSRLPGLERVDVVVTDRVLAGAFHEHLHQVLPGIEEIRVGEPASPGPVLAVHPDGARVRTARDREEEVADFARRLKSAVRAGRLPRLERAALVVRQPLPYVYLARDVLRSAGIPCQMFDALPLAGEQYAAVLDLIFSAVAGGFARVPAIALLRSPHLRIEVEGVRVSPREIAALDRALADGAYLGEISALDRLLAGWRVAAPEARGRSGTGSAHALRAGVALRTMALALEPLRSPAPLASHLTGVLDFLAAYERLPRREEALRERHLRARGAIIGTLQSLRDAFDRFDRAAVDLDVAVSLVRRWIEGQTFAPRTGDRGVHVVDAASAMFGAFDEVQLAGLVEGEWPDAARRNVFYAPNVLRELGWPKDTHRIEGARAAFADLLRLPSARLTVSTFALESDALVNPSPLLNEVDEAGLMYVEAATEPSRVFEEEALSLEPVRVEWLDERAREWATLRVSLSPANDARSRGRTAGHAVGAPAVNSLERYQDCPFRYFAADVLRLGEPVEDDSALSPRSHGRFVHDLLHRFFEAWDRAGSGQVTSENIDAARLVAQDVAEPLLAALPQADAALERTRLFGSAISIGAVEALLALEASRAPDIVSERWLEYRLEGEFALGPDRELVALRGVADRIDLLPGRRLRVIDYKTGRAPDLKRALQAPIYALCAQERLGLRDGGAWTIDEAAYIAFSGKRAYAPVVKAGAIRADVAKVGTDKAGADKAGADDGSEALGEARERLAAVVAGITRGEFPPRPHDQVMCRSCPYPTVCRKDYVDDE